MSDRHPRALTPLRDALQTIARDDPQRIAVRVLDGDVLTYHQLESGSNRVARALLGHGLVPGERVGIWMGNRVEYIEIYVGCLKAGLIVVQLNHRHTALEAQYQLERSASMALFIDDTVAERVDAVDGDWRLLVTIDGDLSGRAVPYLSFRDAASADSLPQRPVDETAVIGFTSGTTGYPKGAELTHRSLQAIGDSNAIANRYVDRSLQIFGFSLSFTAGIPAHVLPHLRVGGTTILMPAWDSERLVDAIAETRATFTILPSPPILDFCAAAQARPRSLNSLVSVLHSTAKAPEAHLERLVEVVGPRLVEGWGMTENSGGLVAATTVDDYSPRRPGILSSTGRPVTGTQVRLMDDNNVDMAHDGTSVGHLLVRSQALARGYWNDPAASAKSFRDGWYVTGDLGTIDDDGYITLVDRRTDLIISGGMNVYPSEVERVLAESPDVAQCVVVGAPHERWGQTPVAFIVRREPTADAESVTEFVRTRLAGYKVPTIIRFVDALPINASGKVQRQELRSQLESSE